MIQILLMLLYVLSAAEATFEIALGVGAGLSVTNLLLYALIFAILARAVLSNTSIQIPLLGVHVMFGLFATYAVLSWTLNSLFEPTYPAFEGLKSLKNEVVDNFLYFLVFFFGANTYEDAKKIFLFALKLVAVMTFLTIVDWLAIVDLGVMEQDADGRVSGPIGESNQYGAFMVFFVPLFAAMAFGSKGVARIFWWFIFLCGFVLLVSTGSRGAYVGVLIGIVLGIKFISPYFDRRKIRRTSLQLGAILLVISIGIGVANIDLVTERFEQSTSTNVDELSSGRSTIWMATLMVQAEKPFTFIYGNGWNSHANSGIWRSAHNTYLLVLYELGIAGLILFGLLLFSIVKYVRVLVKRTEGKEQVLMSGVAFGILGLIVTITFLDMYSPWFYIWSFLGMSLRIAYEKDLEFLELRAGDGPRLARHTA